VSARPAALILAALAAALAAGCEGPLSVSDFTDRCTPTTAQLEVGEGFLRIRCGCAEPSGTVAASGTPLTCTAPAGTTFFILYAATHQRHQIVPTGSPAFPPSPMSSGESDGIRAHAFPLATPGTYAFQDLFDGGLTGSLVVL
jgi:hypothetical protein